MMNPMYKETEILIFFHYPNQLIRSLDIPSFNVSFNHYQHDKLLLFKISQSTIVRRRSDYREPCSNGMKDYDAYLMQEVINKVRCIPPYWLDVVQPNLEFPECISPKQLQEVYSHIQDWNSVIEDSAFPCVDMFNTVVWNWQSLDEPGNSEAIQIRFNYQEQYYQELKYLPDFDLETFISNIGGFLGIFLGYSMMQFPELLSIAFSRTMSWIVNLASYLKIRFGTSNAPTQLDLDP